MIFGLWPREGCCRLFGKIGLKAMMMHLIQKLPKLAVFCGVCVFSLPTSADPVAVRYVPEKEIPDLTQSDPMGKFEGGGKTYCAPVAVSNSLMAMFGEELGWEGVTQYDLVRKLASVGYMNTHRQHGTHLNQFIRGVQRYVKERGMKDCWVRFQGFHKHEKALSAGMCRPRLEWIQGHLAKGGAAWLMAGWYRYDPKKKEYNRDGYHWVTLVGFGEDAEGKPDPEILIVHDPATGAGRRPAREYVRLSQLTEGMIIGALEHREVYANGVYRLGGGMHIKPGSDVALLEGAVVLSIKEPLKRSGSGEDRGFPDEE